MTTMQSKRLALSAAILAACTAGGALAADPSELAQCSSISDTTERLACYDRLAGRANGSKAPPSSPAVAPRSAPSAAPVAAAPAATTPAATATAAATPVQAGTSSAKDFGLSKVQKERAEGAASSSPAQVKAITARVAGFRKGPSGRPRVLLDNGQDWEYEENGDALLAVGDSVTIRRASLGSFLLVTPAKLVHRVRRIR